jgi:hypothetical protein
MSAYCPYRHGSKAFTKVLKGMETLVHIVSEKDGEEWDHQVAEVAVGRKCELLRADGHVIVSIGGKPI